MEKQEVFSIQLSVAGKPFEEYRITRQSDLCNLCESRLCYKGDNLDIDKRFWKDLILTGTAYYSFTKKKLVNGMLLDMSDNPYQPGFCSGSITENKDEAQTEIRKIAITSFCPAISATKQHKVLEIKTNGK